MYEHAHIGSRMAKPYHLFVVNHCLVHFPRPRSIRFVCVSEWARGSISKKYFIFFRPRSHLIIGASQARNLRDDQGDAGVTSENANAAKFETKNIYTCETFITGARGGINDAGHKVDA